MLLLQCSQHVGWFLFSLIILLRRVFASFILQRFRMPIQYSHAKKQKGEKYFYDKEIFLERLDLHF